MGTCSMYSQYCKLNKVHLSTDNRKQQSSVAVDFGTGDRNMESPLCIILWYNDTLNAKQATLVHVEVYT
jgi:hypothetical protein